MCETIITEEKKKRGRKPSKERRGYFYEIQEKAVKDYISSSNDKEKNEIFDEILKPAFTKMIESIIRRYNLYVPDEEFQQTFDDTISFLMTKLSCFDPNKNYKAYSYCGTICKNYLIYKINQYSKNQQRNISYDTPNENSSNDLIDNLKYSYDENDPSKTFILELTGSTVKNIEDTLNKSKELSLTENEIKVGKALVNLMTNWDDLFAQMGSNKFNKSSVLMFLRETTNLDTKSLRDGIKRYKKNYYENKIKLINQ